MMLNTPWKWCDSLVPSKWPATTAPLAHHPHPHPRLHLLIWHAETWIMTAVQALAILPVPCQRSYLPPCPISWQIISQWRHWMSNPPTNHLVKLHFTSKRLPQQPHWPCWLLLLLSIRSRRRSMVSETRMHKEHKTRSPLKRKTIPMVSALLHASFPWAHTLSGIAFGCMYKGTIPGRINLRGNGFVFQTSRMTGGKVLVECAFDDIVGVKKTKQYDMLVWHANGIDISTTDGHVLKFENVLRRDDCFNRLVAASDAGGEWKKM